MRKIQRPRYKRKHDAKENGEDDAEMGDERIKETKQKIISQKEASETPKNEETAENNRGQERKR